MNDFESTYLEAEKALDFLKSDHSFVIGDRKIYGDNESTSLVGGYTMFIKSSDTQNTRYFVRLSTAPLRLEINLDIGIQENDKEESYSIYELHSLEDSGPFPERKHNLYDAVKDPQKLYAEFKILANTLQQCGRRFFENDKSLWLDLRKQRISFLQADRQKQMLVKAENAFKEQNWQKVIDILIDDELKLGEVDRARLNYARKKII